MQIDNNARRLRLNLKGARRNRNPLAAVIYSAAIIATVIYAFLRMIINL